MGWHHNLFAPAGKPLVACQIVVRRGLRRRYGLREHRRSRPRSVGRDASRLLRCHRPRKRMIQHPSDGRARSRWPRRAGLPAGACHRAHRARPVGNLHGASATLSFVMAGLVRVIHAAPYTRLEVDARTFATPKWPRSRTCRVRPDRVQPRSRDKLGTTERGAVIRAHKAHHLALATRWAPELFDSSTLSKQRAQGRPGADLAHGPRANKMHGAGTTGSAKTSRPSLRNGVTAYT
jgi:hypothetical protein